MCVASTLLQVSQHLWRMRTILIWFLRSLWNTSLKQFKETRRDGNVDREERLEKRRKLQFSNETNSEINESTSTSVQEEDQSSGTSVQTDLTMDQLSINFEQLSFAAKKIEDLQKKIDTIWFNGCNFKYKQMEILYWF